MPLLECIASTEDSSVNVGDFVQAKFVRRDDSKQRNVFDIRKYSSELVGRVYWMDSGEIYRCSRHGDKFKEVTGDE